MSASGTMSLIPESRCAIHHRIVMIALTAGQEGDRYIQPGAHRSGRALAHVQSGTAFLFRRSSAVAQACTRPVSHRSTSLCNSPVNKARSSSLLALASIASPTVSPRSSQKPAACTQPDNWAEIGRLSRPFAQKLAPSVPQAGYWFPMEPRSTVMDAIGSL